MTRNAVGRGLQDAVDGKFDGYLVAPMTTGAKPAYKRVRPFALIEQIDGTS